MNDPDIHSAVANDDRHDVKRLADVSVSSVSGLLAKFGLALKVVPGDCDIPGSYWGDEEAGLIVTDLLARMDTPLHSILHESCHFVCMDKRRREGVHTDAGGGYDEENAVCYLQILLADLIKQYDRNQMLRDMDRWGYTFRLGSARAWFEDDAGDARAYLMSLGVTDCKDQPTFKLRDG